MPPRSRLLIVDDSPFMRRAIANLFSDDPSIEIVGEAANGLEALKAVEQLNPQVLTLDINMPIMDGLTALKHLMIRSPRPTLMVSTLTKEGSAITFDALRYGAVDFVTKPSNLPGEDLERQRQEIRHKVHLAAAMQVSAIQYIRAVPKQKRISRETPQRVVLLGAAEGGYHALLRILPQLRADFTSQTAYFVMLYAEPEHVRAFARYLDRYTAVQVVDAQDGQTVESGVCYLSSGEHYVTFLPESGGGLRLHVTPAPFPWRRGSINRLLFSAAEVLGARAIALLLTGSGEDGAEGLVEIAYAGGIVLLQDPETCFDKEMVQNALSLEEPNWLVVPCADLAATINDLVE